MNSKKRGKYLRTLASSKTAQTAIFMIVGLIIIIGGIIFLYATEAPKRAFEPEIKIAQEQVPIEFDPVRKYGIDCAYSVGVEGLKIIGKQGGYASFTDKSKKSAPFTITQNPTESDADP